MLTVEDHALFKAYYQNNSKYYIRLLEKYLEGQKHSFNVRVLLLTIFYISYRKMYGWLVILFLMNFVTSILVDIFFVTENLSTDTYQAISVSFRLVFALVAASFTNSIYIGRSIKHMQQIRRSTDDHEERLKMARKKGGVDWVSPFIILILVFFVYGQF